MTGASMYTTRLRPFVWVPGLFAGAGTSRANDDKKCSLAIQKHQTDLPKHPDSLGDRSELRAKKTKRGPYRPRLRVELMTVAEKTQTWMEKP